MKTTRSSRKLLKPVLATLAIAIVCGVFAPPAQAGYIVSLQQVGPDVVATGSGTINLTGLSLNFSGGGSTGFMSPDSAVLFIGTGASDTYVGSFSNPASFGPGISDTPDSSSGGVVGIGGSFGELDVPQGYVSGTPLSLSSSTFNVQTFSSLGVTPGTYEWTWGTGANQNFTLYAGVPVPAVPDSGSTLGLLLLAVATLFGVSRFRSHRLA
jgi:hypothetical protein